MISFNIEIDNFKLQEKLKLKKWLNDVAKAESFKIGELNYVFLDDDGLLKINIQYLNHDTLTDIITFDNSETKNKIEGDIFISIERIKENAIKFKVNLETELRRVLVHGLLHLCGYGDKTKADKLIMRSKEDFYINIYGKF